MLAIGVVLMVGGFVVFYREKIMEWDTDADKETEDEDDRIPGNRLDLLGMGSLIAGLVLSILGVYQ
jgi:uncharacterized protein YjeT (DUF2065 family)